MKTFFFSEFIRPMRTKKKKTFQESASGPAEVSSLRRTCCADETEATVRSLRILNFDCQLHRLLQ